jgi:hypothetical protein
MTPYSTFSFIMDGMQQDHCMLPHRGNKKPFDKRLPQHIQAILVHGLGIFLFRTFHSVGSCKNLAVQTFLMVLHKSIVANGNRCPDELFLNIDGGPENNNELVLTLMAYLVTVGVVRRRIVVTRFPAGHGIFT